MKALVTGGSGFIGRALVRALLDRGAAVCILDRRSPVETGALESMESVQFVRGDIRNPDALDEALSSGTSAVFHLAAVTSVLKSKEAPVETFETNVAATQLLLERARTVEVGSIVMASTNAVAGDVGGALISETSPLAPLTPYGATKAAAEMLMSAYSASYGLSCTPVRLTNVYGPGMKEKDSFVPRLMRAALDGTEIAVYGDGEQCRDFLYVDDAVAGLLLAHDRKVSGTLTVGSGTSISVLELHRAVCKATSVEIPLRHEPPKPGEMPAVRVDISRARSLGYAPATDMGEGLKHTWESFR